MGIHLCYNWGKLIVLAKVLGWVRIMFQTHKGISSMAHPCTCMHSYISKHCSNSSSVRVSRTPLWPTLPYYSDGSGCSQGWWQVRVWALTGHEHRSLPPYLYTTGVLECIHSRAYYLIWSIK